MDNISKLIDKWIDKIPWLFGMLSVIVSYQYHLRTGMMLLILMTLFFVISGIWGIARKNYITIPSKNLGQRAFLYFILGLFYILSLFSDQVIKTKYLIIALEALALVIQGVWMGLGLKEYFKTRKPQKAAVNRNMVILGLIGLIQWILVAKQAQSQYIWDSRDYCEQINAMVHSFDFTFNNLGTVFLGHISAGFSFVYEMAFFLFGGNLNRIIYMNAILGICVEICVYQIFRTFFPRVRKSRITLATCFVVLMPLFYGVTGCISTDYVMACFFLFFLFAHVKGYHLLQIAFACVFVTTKETAVVLLFVFCFSYLLLELMCQRKKAYKAALLKQELINLLPILLLLVIMLTSGRVSFLDLEQLLNWKVLLLAVGAICLLVILIYLCFTHKLRIQGIICGMICEALILAGICISVLCGYVEGEYGVIENLNSIGYAGIEYVLLRLKNIFILNFQWLYWSFILGMLLYSVYRKGKIYQSSYVIALLLTIFGFVVVHCFYITYTHPRYYQPIILLVGCVGAILALTHKNKGIEVIMLVITVLSFGQNFIGLDKISEVVYTTVDTGDGKLISTGYGKKELPYSDANVYNLEYTYLKELLREFAEDVNPTEDTLFLMPDVSYPYLKSSRSRYVVWGTLWYNDAAKNVYYGDGKLKSYADEDDVRLQIKTINKESKLDLEKYDQVYYIDIPTVTEPESTTEWFKENYSFLEHEVYQKMNWKINTYVVLKDEEE